MEGTFTVLRNCGIVESGASSASASRQASGVEPNFGKCICISCLCITQRPDQRIRELQNSLLIRDQQALNLVGLEAQRHWTQNARQGDHVVDFADLAFDF